MVSQVGEQLLVLLKPRLQPGALLLIEVVLDRLHWALRLTHERKDTSASPRHPPGFSPTQPHENPTVAPLRRRPWPFTLGGKAL